MNKKVATLGTKAELKAEKDEIIKLQASDSSYFRGKNYFEDDGTQTYLVFQPMYKYFKKIADTDHISGWKSKVLSDESMNPPATSDNSLAPSWSYIGTKTRVKFVGSCLKQDKVIFTHEKTVNIYIFYEINLWDRRYDDYPILESSLFGEVKLVKNVIMLSRNILDMVFDLIDVERFSR